MADPCIAVRDIETIFRTWIATTGVKDWFDLFRRLPGQKALTWQTKPDASIMSRTATLMNALLEIAPNTKLQSVKVRAALTELFRLKVLTVPVPVAKDVRTPEQRLEDIVDSVDLGVRINMSWCRTLADCEAERKKIFRIVPNPT